MSKPMETNKIVEKIRTAHKNTIGQKITNDDSLFGVVGDRLIIEIGFLESVPNDSESYSCDRFQCYRVKDYKQVIDVIKELGIEKENTESIIRSHYFNFRKSDNANPFYLVVTSK